MVRSVLETGTTTSQQSPTTRHTVVLWPALLQKHATFGCRPQKMVNVFSRHIAVLGLIEPWDRGCSGAVPSEVRRFYNLGKTHAFRPPAETTNLSRLACEALGTSSQDVGKAWALKAFDAWHELHADLRSRLETHNLPPSMKLEEKQENCSQSVGVIAACSASAEVGPVESPVPEASRDI